MSLKSLPLALLAALIPFTFSPSPVLAQDLKTNAINLEEWRNWENNLGYTMRFPAHLKSTKAINGSWEFQAPDYSLILKAWRDPAWNARQTAYHFYTKWDTVNNKALQKETNISQYIKQTQAQGVMLEGTGIQNGHVVKFVFIGLSNPQTGVNLNLRFAWWNDPQKNQTIESLIEKILGQMQALQTKPNTPTPYGSDPFEEKPKPQDPFKPQTPPL